MNIAYCDGVESLASLAGLTSLQVLNMTRCRSVRDLSPLAHLSHLRTLNATFCDALESLLPVLGMDSLEDLRVGSCIAPGALHHLLRTSSHKSHGRLQRLGLGYMRHGGDLASALLHFGDTLKTLKVQDRAPLDPLSAPSQPSAL